MKKSKLLILGTIAPLTVILPMTVVTACNQDPEKPVVEGEFVCEEAEQTTVRGETACWYIFDYNGSKNIPSDIKVEFNETHDELNSYPLVQVIGDKKLQVGIQGIREQLQDGEPIDFTLKLNSEKLELVDQLIDCKYTYLESQIRPISPKVEERQATDLASGFSIDAEFALTASAYDTNKLSFEFVNIRKSDEENIKDPECEEGFKDVTDHIHGNITVSKKTPWNEGDWIKFDIHFTYENEWEQTITNFTYQALDIDYREDYIDTKCNIQIDVTGDTQSALKAYDEEQQKGFLPKGTPINTPFKLEFHKNDTPEEWTKDPYFNFYKFASFVNPDQYSAGYHHYFSVVVKIVTSTGAEEPLKQTYTGDRAGEFGEWWISTGGPITIIKKAIDDKFPEWQGLIFELRTAQKITHDSSFYLTYAAN